MLNQSKTYYRDTAAKRLPASSPDDKALLQRIANNDEEAFARLFHAWQGRLYYYIRTIIKSPEVAEEVVMDVFTKLWLGREWLPRIDNLDAFLFRIAYHRAIDFLRKASRNPPLTDMLWEEMNIADADSADRKLSQKEFEARVREAIGLLSPQRQKIYQMSRETGWSHDKIATELQLSPNTVNNHISDAIRFIRNYLSNHVDIVLLFLLEITLPGTFAL